MATVWYFAIAAMMTTYVVLDGFDLGAGALHFVVAKTEAERRLVIAAIGPVWDGNEVWLVATGGVLVFAFPPVYAAAFSGFYLPMMLLLWVVILRGVSIELRGQVDNPLWRAFWDATFAGASTAIAFVLGVTLGNVIRGVPLDESRYFAAPLFTNLLPGTHPGALDWYTTLLGALAVAGVTAHAATYLVWKTTGEVHDRARAVLRPAWTISLVLLALAAVATAFVSPSLFARFAARPWVWPVPAIALGGVAFSRRASGRGDELGAFLASAAFLAAALSGAALTLFPTLIPSTLDPAWGLDAFNASSPPRSLALALVWWVPALALAVAYVAFVFRSMRGKVDARDYGH